MSARDPAPGRAPGRAADSQVALAASIARHVALDIPAGEADDGLAGTVQAALSSERKGAELILAWLRAAVLLVFAALMAVGVARPSLAGATTLGPGAVLVGAIGAIAATGLLMALLRGWYVPLLRLVVPAGDSLLIGAGIILLDAAQGPPGGSPSPGVAAIGAAACLFLAFSGAARMSHASQRVSIALAIVDWVFIALVLPVPLIPALFIGLLLVAAGVAGRHFTGRIRRVVENEIARGRLDRLYREAAAAIEAREEVLRIVAHDLRNPLNTINLTAEMMLEMAGDETPASRPLEIIMRNAATMDRLVHDLLDVARLEAGRVSINAKETPVQPLLDRVLELTGASAAAAGIDLQLHTPDELPPLYVDPDRVLQLFSNLVGNAIKFTPEGGRVSVRAASAGRHIRFAVSDTGPGIPPERIDHIFDKFWQADAGDRRGLGLGLAIARSIVDAHGGRIGIESRPGEGSEFWFTLPTAHGADPGDAEQPAVAADASGARYPA